MSDIQEDRNAPSDAALKELHDPEYLAQCVVTCQTTIRDTTVTYDVAVGGWFVWSRTVTFGDDRAHRAAGAAFVGVAREQERVMHDWADMILDARLKVGKL